MKKLHFVVSLPNDNSYQHEQAASATETALRLGAEVPVLHPDNDAVTQSQQLLEIIQSRICSTELSKESNASFKLRFAGLPCGWETLTPFPKLGNGSTETSAR